MALSEHLSLTHAGKEVTAPCRCNLEASTPDPQVPVNFMLICLKSTSAADFQDRESIQHLSSQVSMI